MEIHNSFLDANSLKPWIFFTCVSHQLQTWTQPTRKKIVCKWSRKWTHIYTDKSKSLFWNLARKKRFRQPWSCLQVCHYLHAGNKAFPLQITALLSLAFWREEILELTRPTTPSLCISMQGQWTSTNEPQWSHLVVL